MKGYHITDEELQYHIDECSHSEIRELLEDRLSHLDFIYDESDEDGNRIFKARILMGESYLLSGGKKLHFVDVFAIEVDENEFELDSYELNIEKKAA